MVGREEVVALLKQHRVVEVLLLWLVVVEVVEVNDRWRQQQAVRKSLHRSLEIEAAEAAADDLVAVVVVEQLVVAVEVSVWLGLALVLAAHRVCMWGKFVDAGTRT